MTDLNEVLDAEDQEPEEMTETRFTSVVTSLVTDAENWIQTSISPGREKAQNYYKGKCDVKHQPGRSQFVMRTVRDTVEQMIPKIMKSFTGGVSAVSFQATKTDKRLQSQAADKTAAFNRIFWDENDGWSLLQEFSRDALKAKTGIFKAYWKDEITVSEREWQGPFDQYLALQQELDQTDDDVTLSEYREDVTPSVINGIVSEQINVDVTFKIVKKDVRLAIETVPPEEWLIDRAATSSQAGFYTLIGQRSIKTVSDIVAMGVPQDIALKYAGVGNAGAFGGYQEQERRARRPLNSDQYEDRTQGDNATKLIVYYDLYIRLDKDQDGFAELRRVTALGEGPAFIFDDMIVDKHPYYDAAAIPIEHSPIGWSVADNTTDLQDVETQLTRFTLDNAALVQNPRRMCVKDQYEEDQLIDNELGGKYDVDVQGAVQFEHIPFVGDKLLAVREAFDETRAERTGISRESMGLDAQNLQASSEIGVLAVLGAGMEQPDMIAANFANKAMGPMAIDVAAMLKERGEPLDVESDGVFRQVNPAEWEDDMLMRVNVGLGTGTKEEKLAALFAIKAEQKEILLAIGADNGIVTPAQYTHTLHQIAKLSGIGQSTSYYNSPDEVQQFTERKAKEAASKPPPKPPVVQKAEVDAQTDIAKAQISAKGDIEEAEIKADSQEEIADLDRQAKTATSLLEMAEESRLTELAIERGVGTNTNLRNP